MPETSSPARGHNRTGSGVRKRGNARVSNACERCRRQKIKCSGKEPCDACQKRRLVCNFDEQNQKILVTREQLAQLQREAHRTSTADLRTPPDDSQINAEQNNDVRSSLTGPIAHLAGDIVPSFESVGPVDDSAQITSGPYLHPVEGDATSEDPARLGLDIAAETEHDSCNRSTTGDQHFTNPLVNGPPAFTVDEFGAQSYLGTSSNWSFGRRVLVMVHESLFGLAPPPGRLLFEGQAYEVDWQGNNSSNMGVRDESLILPTSDFALFLINTVKFRCGQLFHLFDEETFMQSFSKFHSNEHPKDPVGTLWYAHYLLVLALGKALVVIFTSGTKPAGSELFVEGMRLMPDIGLTAAEPIQSMEILCCAALYLQCLDKRKAAYNQIGRALRTALVEGSKFEQHHHKHLVRGTLLICIPVHTNMSNRNLADPMRERCRAIWWTIYILDSHMSALMGVPQSLSEHDVTAQLPEFAAHTSKSLALGIHVKLARATSSILQTIYGRDGREPSKFLHSIKDALNNLASIHDDRVANFRIHLGNSSVSRLSAYLLLFQHQCIILATRPLLFHFWQRRLASQRQIHIPSSGGARSLVRICIGAAQQILRTLEVLQSQSLLESLVPFDLESTWSASVVILVAHTVDRSLIRNVDELRQISFAILSEMVARGNRVAGFYKEELELLEHHLQELASAGINLGHDYGAAGAGPASNSNSESTGNFDTTGFSAAGPSIQEWYFDDGMIDGEQLLRAADSLDIDAFQWYTDNNFEGLDASLL